MGIPTHLLVASSVAVASVGAFAGRTATATADAPASACIAISLPTVEGVPGNAAEVASGLRDLLVSYLATPSVRVIALEARLPSQAVEEAKQKRCEPLLFASLTRKSGSGRLSKALGQAAGSSSWYLPGGGTAASAATRAAAAGGLQAVSSLAASTKAKDEVRLQYRLQSGTGQVELGPNTDTQKASADGEDIVTPVVMRAAEAIVTRKGAK